MKQPLGSWAQQEPGQLIVGEPSRHGAHRTQYLPSTPLPASLGIKVCLPASPPSCPFVPQAPAAVEPVEAVQEDDGLQERLNAMRTT